MAECCINPVAPALANAVANATGVRYRSLPLSPERIYAKLGSSQLVPVSVSMDTKKPTDTAATVIIGQKVRPGSERDFEAWQQEMNREASKYPGFIGAEINPPTAVQAEWVVVYRFDSVAHVQAWINSATRQERLAEGQQYFDGPGTQQVVGGGAKATDPLVTVVVSHRVSPEQVDEFLAWQERLRLAESEFPGFRGTELFRPVKGVQDDWTAMYRYDTAADLDRWLVSKERRDLLAEGEKFSDFELRTVDNSFGSWFAFDEHGNAGAATVGHQDVDRGVGGPLPDRRAAHARAVPIEDAAVAGHAGRKPVVQLPHQLRGHAVLREPAAEALAATAPGCAEATNELAGHRHRRRRHAVLDGGRSTW